MRLLSRHWPRIAVTLIPLVFALLHAGRCHCASTSCSAWTIFCTMPACAPRCPGRSTSGSSSWISTKKVWPRSADGRGAATGWPSLVEGTAGPAASAAMLGFDVVFAEADDSSGLEAAQAAGAKRNEGPARFCREAVAQTPGQVSTTTPLFAKAIANRPVVLGYYFTSDRDGRTNGALPAPVMSREAHERAGPSSFTTWNGYGSNIDSLVKVCAHGAGFSTPSRKGDGVVRSIPLAG